MKEKRNFKLQLALVITNLIIASIIIVYFWSFHKDYTQKIEMFIMILALVYISIEMLKKNFHYINAKWSRLYYIGMFGIVAPIAFEKQIDIETVKIINQLAILFLAIPLLIEGKALLNTKKVNGK